MAQLDGGAVRRHEGLGLIVLAGAVSAGLALGLWSGQRPDTPAPIAVASSTGQQPQARRAAPVRAADRQGPVSDEQRRRLLLILMMNSAGPLGPFGKVGR
jgi:hypothetical protein